MNFPTRQTMALPVRTLASIYRPRYVVLNIAAFVVYYYAYLELIAYQNLGVFLSNVSEGLLYALVLTSSMLLTIAVYSIRNTRNNRASVSATTLGTVATLFGGVIGGCGCSVPVDLQPRAGRAQRVRGGLVEQLPRRLPERDLRPHGGGEPSSDLLLPVPFVERLVQDHQGRFRLG